MASSLRGYLRRLRLFNLAAPIVVEAVLRLDGMDHGGAPSLSQQPPSFLPLPLVRSKLCRLLELLEPERQSVPVGAILTPPRQLDLLPDDPFQAEFEKRTIMDFEQPVRDVDAEIGVNADQVIWRILVSGNTFETIGCLIRYPHP